MRLSFRPVVGLLLLQAGLFGCLPPQASFSPGFGTTEVRGTIDLPPPDPGAGPPLIVVLRYHSMLTGFAGEQGILRQSAAVPTVGTAGQFSIAMPQDVTQMDILFIAPDRITDTFRFQRQLGVGTVTYVARLPVVPGWRAHFYTFLAPQLEHLVVDTRYGLSPRDQERLTQWVTDQRRRLETTGEGSQQDNSAAPRSPR